MKTYLFTLVLTFSVLFSNASDKGTWTGFITDDSEQLVVGASDPIFIAGGQWEQIDDTARNPVIWQRVEQNWDCEKLATERAALFPPNPKIDW